MSALSSSLPLFVPLSHAVAPPLANSQITYLWKAKRKIRKPRRVSHVSIKLRCGKLPLMRFRMMICIGAEISPDTYR
ncbi:hypothetical protein BKA58DRAFT_128867 [Alternaria rosae]|uniref:uncharacterized protein n=1 Tax=Alternaria rosae TaxID=1187941 RepID=UPI001E8D836E|nr:uncharacterized protein BKA58DRAFT_128867 [Alternaria rosae]KAH6875796.1 hypothetical protein BKA58DRAFT_128867 [Alternaria rosae]